MDELPKYPQYIKPITIYEGIGLLEITDDFKPKGLIEKFDYWCYKRSLKKTAK